MLVLVEAFEEPLGYGVTFASGVHEAFAIQDLDAAAAIGEEARFLQVSGDFRDRCASAAEHLSEEFLGKVDGGFVYLVLRHEQPARESAVYFVEPIAGGELAEKQGAVLHVAQDQRRYITPGHELFLESLKSIFKPAPPICMKQRVMPDCGPSR